MHEARGSFCIFCLCRRLQCPMCTVHCMRNARLFLSDCPESPSGHTKTSEATKVQLAARDGSSVALKSCDCIKHLLGSEKNTHKKKTHKPGWLRNRTGTGNRNRFRRNRTLNRNRRNRFPGTETGTVLPVKLY